MSGRNHCCDLCSGTDFEPYFDVRVCGRDLARCRGCGLVAAAGAPVRSSDGARPGRDPRSDARRAAALMHLLPSGRVLEIGCAEGRVLARLDPVRYEVVGLEPDEKAAKSASDQLARAGSRGAVIGGGATDPRLKPGSFDLVAMFGTLARSPSPRATLMGVARLLASGGYAVIETPSLSSLTARIRGPKWSPLRDPDTDYFFTAASLQRLATMCGFLPCVTRPPVPAGWPAPGTIVYVARRSAETLDAPGLEDLISDVGSATPLGATR